MSIITRLTGDCRDVLLDLPDQHFSCCITSPPYFGLRSYLPDGHPDKAREIGTENCLDCLAWATGAEPCTWCYLCHLCDVFGGKGRHGGVWRVLKDDGVLWVNLGDSYSAGVMSNPSPTSTLTGGKARGEGPARPRSVPMGLKAKELCMVPARLALALQAAGWYVRCNVIWSKSNGMPESVTDRPTKSHEYLWMLTKQEQYAYDPLAMQEPCVNGDPLPPRGSRGNGAKMNAGRRKQDAVGDKRYTGFNERYTPRVTRNRRSVWNINTSPLPDAHFAVFPKELVAPCLLSSSPVGGHVLDPFGGSGTVSLVAAEHGRHCTLIDINSAYVDGIQPKRLARVQPRFQMEGV